MISPLLPLLREGWGSCRCRLLEGRLVLLGLLWLCSCTALSSTRTTSLGCPVLQSDIFHPCPVWWWFALALCWSGLSPAGKFSCCYISSLLFSISWHCSSIQSIFDFFMPFLISWLTALYCLIPSASFFFFFFFFNSLRLSHRSSKSAVTQGFLTGRSMCAKGLTGGVGHCCVESVDQCFHVCTISVQNSERCKFSSYHCVEGFCYFGVLQLLKVKFDPGVVEFLDPLQV